MIRREMVTPFHPKMHVQPKLIPTAAYQQRLAADYAHLLKYRQKLLYAHFGQVSAIPASAGVGTTNRLFFHGVTDPFSNTLVVQLGIARSNYTPKETAAEEPNGCRIDVTVVGSTSGTNTYSHYIGVSGGGTSQDVPSEWSWPRLRVPCAAGETIGVVIAAVDEARLITASAWCDPLDTNDEVYYSLSEVAAAPEGPILISSRMRMATNFTLKWKNAGAVLMAWHDFGDPFTRTSSTYINMTDGSSTSVSSSTGGFQVETTRHNTVAQSTVPVRLAVYAQTASGSAGKIRVEHAGGTVAEITNISTTLGWYTATGSIPAGSTKCDFQAAGSGSAQVSIYGATLYEYQA